MIPGTGARVLLVEDDDALRETLQACMELEGYEVCAARNGAEALERAREHTPALIITDLRMPEMDGYAFLQARLEDPEMAGIPVIVMSAERDLAERDLGAVNAVLPKPLELEQLLDALHSTGSDTPPLDRRH